MRCRISPMRLLKSDELRLVFWSSWSFGLFWPVRLRDRMPSKGIVQNQIVMTSQTRVKSWRIKNTYTCLRWKCHCNYMHLFTLFTPSVHCLRLQYRPSVSGLGFHRLLNLQLYQSCLRGIWQDHVCIEMADVAFLLKHLRLAVSLYKTSWLRSLLLNSYCCLKSF